MRHHLLRRLIARSVALAALSLLVLPARGQDTPPEDAPARDGGASPAASGVSVTLSAPDRLIAGTTAMVVAEVHVPPSDSPLLLTPTTEGTAVEVVRGRLLRADAERSANGTLRFRIPIIAKSAGTSVLRVRVMTYACARRCRAEEADAFLVLRVDRS